MDHPVYECNESRNIQNKELLHKKYVSGLHIGISKCENTFKRDGLFDCKKIIPHTKKNHQGMH